MNPNEKVYSSTDLRVILANFQWLLANGVDYDPATATLIDDSGGMHHDVLASCTATPAGHPACWWGAPDWSRHFHIEEGRLVEHVGGPASLLPARRNGW